MSNRITYQNNIVTAKKFVQIGTNQVSARQKLKDVLTAYKEVDNSRLFAEVRQMMNDEKFEPSEKVALKERWDSVSSVYNNLLRSLANNGLSGVPGEDLLREKYEEVYVLCQEIFADMNSVSAVPDGFETKWNSLQEQLSIVSQSYMNLVIKAQEFRLQLLADRYYPEEGENTVVTATLLRGSEAYTGADLDTIMATLEWTITGVTNPETLINGATITVPYDSFADSFYVSATVDIPIEDL